MKTSLTYEELTARKKVQFGSISLAMIVLAILCLALGTDPALASNAMVGPSYGMPWEGLANEVHGFFNYWRYVIPPIFIIIALSAVASLAWGGEMPWFISSFIRFILRVVSAFFIIWVSADVLSAVLL